MKKREENRTISWHTFDAQCIHTHTQPPNTENLFIICWLFTNCLYFVRLCCTEREWCVYIVWSMKYCMVVVYRYFHFLKRSNHLARHEQWAWAFGPWCRLRLLASCVCNCSQYMYISHLYSAPSVAGVGFFISTSIHSLLLLLRIPLHSLRTLCVPSVAYNFVSQPKI